VPREGYITASSFAGAIGANPYCSRQKTYRLLAGLETEESNFATQNGNNKEWLAIARYEAITGSLVHGQQTWFEAELENGLKIGCHVDGLSGTSELTVVEAKTPTSVESFDKNYPAPPEYYLPQVQGQMALSGASRTHFVANADFPAEGVVETRIWLIEPNLEYWGEVKRLLQEFWISLRDGKEPKRAKRPTLPKLKIERIV
jgi:predicted phage-related endonuclease